jgi:hypothetical protein
VRRHLWGGESFFEVTGGKPGEQVAVMVAEFLREKKGWNTEVIHPAVSGRGQPPASATTATPSGVSAAEAISAHDVTLAGKVLDLSVNADSKFMRTHITVSSKVLVQGVNAADGSTVRLTLNGAGSQSVFWFEPEDVQTLLRDVIAESLEKLAADTEAEGRVLRLKQ